MISSDDRKPLTNDYLCTKHDIYYDDKSQVIGSELEYEREIQSVKITILYKNHLGNVIVKAIAASNDFPKEVAIHHDSRSWDTYNANTDCFTFIKKYLIPQIEKASRETLSSDREGDV